MCGLDSIIWSWLISEPTVTKFGVQPTFNQWTDVIAPDPNRFMILISNTGSSNIRIDFGNNNAFNGMFALLPSTTLMPFTLRDHGSWIQEKVRCNPVASGGIVNGVSLAMNPQKQEIYREYVRQWLSKFKPL